MSHFQSRWLAPALLCASFTCNMYAVDGIVLIDQNRALGGNVTPGDAPGFPVTISLSGSYRLSGNLTVADANTTAIRVTADNVTIDLNGFSIIGPTVCVGFSVTSCSPSGSGRGVDGGGASNITVVNGRVRGMGNEGIALGFAGRGGYVEKVRVESNGGDGISTGSACLVSGSTANFNAGSGITTGNHCTVSGNTAAGNRLYGIFAAQSTVSGNTANVNSSGIFVVCPGSVVGNTAVGNAFTNLDASGGCALANNAAP